MTVTFVRDGETTQLNGVTEFYVARGALYYRTTDGKEKFVNPEVTKVVVADDDPRRI